jgi:Asp-tRNA(Asn)/Glu-tRNA(Gln) amidotransferase A subunit family amidase
MVPIALGEQTHGSNLRPAAYCGLAGLKPTFGRISRFGCYQFSWSHDHVGLIGLTVEDVALALSVIAGQDPLDPTTLQEPVPPADLDLGNLRPPRIGVVHNFFPERTQAIMQEAIERAAATMREAGAAVSDVLLPEDFGAVWPVHHVIGGAESSTFHARKFAQSGRTVLRDRVTAVLPASYYLQAQRIRGLLWRKTQSMFDNVDALLMGAAPGPAPEGLSTTGDGSLLVPWSCLGYPAATINGGLSPSGLPLGLQFVAPPLAEHPLLRSVAWCEAVIGRLPAPALA